MESASIHAKDVDGYVTADGRKRSFRFEDVKVEHHSSYEIINFERDIRAKYWQIQRDDIVVDVGANFGSYTLPALARGAQLVLAFEPGTEFIQSLRNNLRLNNWGDRCATIKTALNSNDPTNGDRAIYSSQHMALGRNDDDSSETIRMTSLDKFLEHQYPFCSHIDWIKIDVEGMELDVLKGAENTLIKYRPKLLVELHNTLHPNIKQHVLDYLKSILDVKQFNVEYTDNDTSYLYVNPQSS